MIVLAPPSSSPPLSVVEDLQLPVSPCHDILFHGAIGDEQEDDIRYKQYERHRRAHRTYEALPQETEQDRRDRLKVRRADHIREGEFLEAGDECEDHASEDAGGREREIDLTHLSELGRSQVRCRV